MNKVFIFLGVSGAGKSTLLDRIVKDGYCCAAKKYSERKKFSAIDDVTSVEDIGDPQLQCDMVYSMYGNRYGFSSKDLKVQLKHSSLVLITNDKITIENIKKIFPGQVVVIYIVSDINKSVLRRVYIKRHGIPSLKAETPQISIELQKANEMLEKDMGEGFVEHMEAIDDILDNIILKDKEFELRLESIRHQEELYPVGLYDYVIFNLFSNSMTTIHATKSAYEQLKKIIKKETGKKNE